MRKVLFNVLLVLENVLRLDILLVLSFIMAVFSTVYGYVKDTSTLYEYLPWYVKADTYFGKYVVMLLLCSVALTSLKMLVNSLAGLNSLKLIKSVLPVSVGVILSVFLPLLLDKLGKIFYSTAPYNERLIFYILVVWLALMIELTKRLVSSNTGFFEVSSLSESNSIALRYYDGVLRDLDSVACEEIALKYYDEGGNHE